MIELRAMSTILLRKCLTQGNRLFDPKFTQGIQTSIKGLVDIDDEEVD